MCSRFKDKISEIWWQLYRCTLALKSCTLSEVLHTKSNLICWILNFKHVIYPLYLSKPSVIPLSYCVNFLSDNSSLTSFVMEGIFFVCSEYWKAFLIQTLLFRCKSMMYQPKNSVLTHGCICWLCHVIFILCKFSKFKGFTSILWKGDGVKVG